MAALPGAPGFCGNIKVVVNRAVDECNICFNEGLQGVIVENFNDAPFFPSVVPAETIAAMARICGELKNKFQIPIGINVLRNDGIAAVAVASACEADFVRINILSGAMLTDQGIIQSDAAAILRYKKNLNWGGMLFADIRVKHAVAIQEMPLADEVSDLEKRSCADAIIVTGNGTGKSADLSFVKEVKQLANKPLLIGSGINSENLQHYISLANGFIVGSCFKKDGKAENELDPASIKKFMRVYFGLI